MNEAYEFLKKAEVFYIATIDENRPSCRPFGVTVMYQDKIYMLTSSEKQVSKQIAVYPEVCIVAYDSENWIRIFATLVDDSECVEAKQLFLDTFPELVGDGYALENANMQVLYLKNAEATIYGDDGPLAVYHF